MTQPALYDRIVKVTRAALGCPINPHLFRDCAATSIAVDDPDHVRIVAPLLGHCTLATSERHYNQARTREAALRCKNISRIATCNRCFLIEHGPMLLRALGGAVMQNRAGSSGMSS